MNSEGCWLNEATVRCHRLSQVISCHVHYMNNRIQVYLYWVYRVIYRDAREAERASGGATRRSRNVRSYVRSIRSIACCRTDPSDPVMRHTNWHTPVRASAAVDCRRSNVALSA